MNKEEERKVINGIDKRLEELNKEKEIRENAATYKQIKKLFTIAAPVMAFTSAAICLWLSGNSPLTYTFATSFGNINGVLGLGTLFSAITIPVSISVVKHEKKNCENTEKEKVAINREIEYLNKQKAEIINNIKTNSKENGRYKDLTGREKLAIIKDYGRDAYTDAYRNTSSLEKAPTLTKKR